MVFERPKKASGQVVAWLEAELRSPSWQKRLRRYCDAQAEVFMPEHITVAAIHESKLICRLPAYAKDHESPHPFACEVLVDVHPSTGRICRSLDL